MSNLQPLSHSDIEFIENPAMYNNILILGNFLIIIIHIYIIFPIDLISIQHSVGFTIVLVICFFFILDFYVLKLSVQNKSVFGKEENLKIFMIIIFGEILLNF